MSFIGDAEGGWVSGGDLAGGGDISASSGGFDFKRAFGSIADGALNVAGSVVQMRAARESAAFQRQMQAQRNALESQKIGGQIEIEKLRTAAAIREQRRALDDSGILSMFYRPGISAGVPSSGGSYNLAMIAIAAASLFFAWKLVK